MTSPLLLLGDEAIAQAALDAGISGAYAYPGTPSTEILTYIQEAAARDSLRLHHQWSTNEKTAFEAALGMSYCGQRALVSMKHVGLNVAADPFINAAITGVHGGLVLVAADDPGMHSSQNEQDSRFFAHFACVPLVEPTDQQDCYDLTRAAFRLSEDQQVPVMLRLTTRLAHSRAGVRCAAAEAQRPLRPADDRRRFVLLPANARRNYLALLAKQPALEALSAASPANRLVPGPDRALGIVAAGIAWNYLRECFADITGGCPHPTLKLGQYPVPTGLLRQLASQVDALLVLEEGMPVIEEALKGLLPGPLPIHGRLDGALPRTGELAPEHVAAALGRPVQAAYRVPAVVTPRPPRLCQGCAHSGSYSFLQAALRDFPAARVFSDIGCYTLGALSPYEAIDTCVDMGASVTMAKGAADAGLHPAVAVIGDSTFTHSGMTGLLDCVQEATPVTVVIMDNDTVAMTGGQDSMAADGKLERICLGLGVEPAHLRVLDPAMRNVDDNAAVLREELAYRGVSVLISRRVCLQAAIKRKKTA